MHKEGGNFTGPLRQKTFTEYPNIRKHIEPSHEEERFSCTVCNNRFTGRYQLKTHVARHSEATDFMCDDCGEQTFTEYPNIRKHIVHSHEEERFSYTVCNNRFSGRCVMIVASNAIGKIT